MAQGVYDAPLQIWRASFSFWAQAVDMQMSMMRAFLPKDARGRIDEAAEAAGDPAREAGAAAAAGTDFARLAARSLAEERGADKGAFPV